MLSATTTKNPSGVVDVGSAVLRRRAVELSKADLASPLFTGLLAEMSRCLGNGVGVAAPQVGSGVRVVLVEDGPHKWGRAVPAPDELALKARERTPLPRMVLINPVLTPLSDERTEFFETCLSIGDIAAPVTRYRSVHLAAWDASGDVVDGDFHGWPARILQHEVDHLDGVLLFDKADLRLMARTAALEALWLGKSVAEIRAAMLGGDESLGG